MSNRYSRKMHHKKNLKMMHAIQWGYHSWESFERNSARYTGIGQKYWWCYYISERRNFAKSSTNRLIRSKFHNLSRFDDDFDDIPTIRNANYRKYFDYYSVIW